MQERPKKTKYKTYILFSDRDQEVADDIRNHLKILEREQDLGNILSRRIDSFPTPESVSQLVSDSTIFVLFLISYPFVLSRFGENFKKTTLSKEANCKRIRLYSIAIDNCYLGNSYLGKVPRLESNFLAVREVTEKKYHEHLSLMALEFCELILAATEHQRAIDEHWEKACEENSIQAYLDFYKANPLSKYGQRAKTKYEELLEEKLWKEAQSFKKIKYYLDYLRKVPNKNTEHENEAIEKIIEIESSERAARKDMEQNSNLGILLEYKTRHREDGELEKVNQKLYESFQQPLDELINEHAEIKTEANFLNHEIVTKCTQEEVFTFLLLEKTKIKIEQKVTELKKKAKNVKSALDTAVVFGFLLFLLIVFSYILVKPEWPSALWSLILGSLLFSILVLVARMYNAINSDISGFSDKLTAIGQKFIRLKVALLLFDKLSQARIALFLNNLEEWAEKNKNKNLGYYFNHAFDRNKQITVQQLESGKGQINQLSGGVS